MVTPKNTDPFWASRAANATLYIQSEFTSTIRESIRVDLLPPATEAVEGITWDGTNTSYIGQENAVTLSGSFTSTIKNSHNYIAFSNFLPGITVDEIDTWLDNSESPDELLHFSGKFTSTLKDSLDTITTFSSDSPQAISVDDVNTLFGDRTDDKLWLLSGKNPMTSTVVDSITIVNDDYTGVSTDKTDSYAVNGDDDILKHISGIFTSTIKTSVDVTFITNRPDGIEIGNHSARFNISSVFGSANLVTSSLLVSVLDVAFGFVASLISSSVLFAELPRDSRIVQLSITGHIADTSFTELFISSKVMITDTKTLFIEVEEATPVSGDISLFAYGSTNPKKWDNIPLFMDVGSINPNVNLNLFLEQLDTSLLHSGLINLYILNDNTHNNNIPLYIPGPSGINDNTTLYMHGPQVGTSGWVPDNENVSLFIGDNDLYTWEKRLHLYLDSYNISSGDLTAFIDGIITQTENTELYIEGLETDNKALRIHISGY